MNNSNQENAKIWKNKDDAALNNAFLQRKFAKHRHRNENAS